MLPVPWVGLTSAAQHGGSAEGKDLLVSNSVPGIMFNLKIRGLQLSHSFSAGRICLSRVPGGRSERWEALHFPLALTWMIPCCLTCHAHLVLEGDLLKHRYTHASTPKKWIPDIVIYNWHAYCTHRHRSVRRNCRAVSVLGEGFSPTRAEHNDQAHPSAACWLLWSSLSGRQLVLFSFWSIFYLLKAGWPWG